MSETATLPSVTLDNALRTHVLWKQRLVDAVHQGETLDVAAIRRDDRCELGIWLHTTGRTLYGHRPEFQQLMDSHREFHTVTAIVADMVNQRDTASAVAMLHASSPLRQASMQVGLAINALKAVAT